jgi:hypothetical protein
MGTWTYELTSGDKRMEITIQGVAAYRWTQTDGSCMALPNGGANPDGGKWTLKTNGEIAMVLNGAGTSDVAGRTGRAHGEGVDFGCPYDWDWHCTRAS